jgi:protein TonB
MIKGRNTETEASVQGLTYTHEQRYGLITSLLIHSFLFILFLAISLHKGSNDIKTFYIQFTQMDAHTAQAPPPVKDIKRPKPVEPQKRQIRKEMPMTKEPPVREHDAVIKNYEIEGNEAVSVASPPATESQVNHSQDGESTESTVSYTVSPGSSSVIETEFGAGGAPAFLKRQMPVYPTMAKRLGKQGRVVLRLFINDKGKLLDVEVVEHAGYGFTESALEAVRRSTFSPAHHNGLSIASKAFLTIRFVLKKDL